MCGDGAETHSASHWSVGLLKGMSMRKQLSCAFVLTLFVCLPSIVSAAGADGGGRPPDGLVGPAVGQDTRDEGASSDTRQATRESVPMEQPAEPSEAMVVEYEAATGTEFLFRSDRWITGVWRPKSGSPRGAAGPDLIIADRDHCLYGVGNSTWGPLDCPDGNFLVEGHVPNTLAMAAFASSGRTSAVTWRWIDLTRRAASTRPPQDMSSNQFVLANHSVRPMESGDSTGEGRAPKLDCWVDENPGGMFSKIECCLVVETLPNDPVSPLPHMDGQDTSLPARYCTSKRIPAMPDINSGSIVVRENGGREYCLRLDGSVGACNTENSIIDRGIKEKGIK